MPLKIIDEFSDLISAIVHDGSNAKDISMEEWQSRFTPEQLADHPEVGPVERQRVLAEVAGVHELLRAKGVELHFATPLPEATAQVFARDPSFVVGQTFFLARMEDSYRQDEWQGLRDLYKDWHPVHDLSQGSTGTIEGGDLVFARPRKLLVGQGPMTDQAGLASLEKHLAARDIDVVAVSHQALHLDCCLAPLPDGAAFIARNAFSEQGLAAVKQQFSELIEVDPDEARLHLAANLFWINPREVISNRAATKLNRLLAARGYVVHALDLTHVTRKWGGVRCLICPVARR